jgi:hypothetical protein
LLCGYGVYAACVSLGGKQPEVRERIGEWLARGYGREFMAEMDLHFRHLGPGANHTPVAEHLRREFAAEIEKARQEDDELLRQSGGSHELAAVRCDDWGEPIRAEDDMIENLWSRTVAIQSTAVRDLSTVLCQSSGI